MYQLRKLVTNHKSLNEASNKGKWEFFAVNSNSIKSSALYDFVQSYETAFGIYSLSYDLLCYFFLLKCELL